MALKTTSSLLHDFNSTQAKTSSESSQMSRTASKVSMSFQAPFVSGFLPQIVTAGAGMDPVSCLLRVTRTLSSRYLWNEGKPKNWKKIPKSESCKIIFKKLIFHIVYTMLTSSRVVHALLPERGSYSSAQLDQ